MQRGVFRHSPRSFPRALRAGVFDERRAEMIEGIPYVMGTNPPHIDTVLRMAEVLRGILLRDRWTVAEETMIEIASSCSCPIPDIVVLSGPLNTCLDPKITPGDVRLLVEVCDSSWARGVKEKLLVYAGAGIVECWLVRLRTRRLYRSTRPTADGFSHRQIHDENDRVPFEGTTLAVADFLPGA